MINYNMNKIEIVNIKKEHEPLSDKDFICAFIYVYKNINLLLSSKYFKQDINDSIIWEAISNVYTDFSTQQERLHFLLCLTYQTTIRRNNKEYMIISTDSFINLKLKPFEVQQIAVAKINAVRQDDGFLAFIKDSTVKKYENIEEMIKFIYSQDETEFKRILVKLGINND